MKQPKKMMWGFIKNDLENMLDIAETTQDRGKLDEFNTMLQLLSRQGYDIHAYQIKGNEVSKKIPTQEGFYR